MIGGGSTVNYGGVCGFMGFFIVRAQFRGRGFGRQLWTARRDRLIKRLHAPARIEMDGVFHMQSFTPRAASSFYIATCDFKAWRLEKWATLSIHRLLARVAVLLICSLLHLMKYINTTKVFLWRRARNFCDDGFHNPHATRLASLRMESWWATRLQERAEWVTKLARCSPMIQSPPTCCLNHCWGACHNSKCKLMCPNATRLA